MGKASSNKKVARAAGIGGSRTLHRRQTPWGYFAVIALIVVLGIVGTVSSRDHRLAVRNNVGNTPPTVGQSPAWNEGYAVYVCGKFLPPISSSANPDGIYTDKPGSGIIHISPKKKSVAGKNATLGKVASAVGMGLNAAELQVPGGKQYINNDSCEGSSGHVYVKQFSFVGDVTGQLYNGDTKDHQLARLDPRDVPLMDQVMITIAFVPASKASSIPPPPGYVSTKLTALAVSSSSTSTTVPATIPVTTIPVTSTTVKK